MRINNIQILQPHKPLNNQIGMSRWEVGRQMDCEPLRDLKALS